MINHNDISVIVQGAIDKDLTKKALESIRAFMPEAEIILSTWEDSDLTSLDYDKLVLSKDPGFIKVNLLGNTNRQIVGRLEALKQVTRKYCLVMRSDSEIINLNFVNSLFKFNEHKYSENHYLSSRICACSFGPIWLNWLYHIADWFFFGETKDLINLYDIELFKEDKNADYDEPKYLTPHNWLMYNFAKKNCQQVEYKELYKTTKKDKDLYLRILVENFIVLGFDIHYGIRNNKEPYLQEKLIENKKPSKLKRLCFYSFDAEDYVNLYNRVYNKKIFIKYRLGWILCKIKIMFSKKCNKIKKETV
jgi:hypothetical protein